MILEISYNFYNFTYLTLYNLANTIIKNPS